MQKENPGEYGHTLWGPFESETKYFHPSKRDFMINYRVENLEDLIEQLKKEGVEVIGEIEKYDYGKFGWIMDPEGNKTELWEPVDRVFRKANGLDG
jgi:predicted enzyme related to lactoylglutathione lyase